jgi:hypothetical protein
VVWVCAVCRMAFSSLARSRLASPMGGGTGLWVHKTCLDGSGQLLLGTAQYLSSAKIISSWLWT